MSYYCFLCNELHDDAPTEEHFIPRSIDGPESQWLPVCDACNTRSNTVFDNEARDLLYYVRFQHTRALKRSGEALLGDGTLKPFKFAFHQGEDPHVDAAFRYIYDRATDAHISNKQVYAIAFPVGLRTDERMTLCRGLAKMSLGAMVFLLRQNGVEQRAVTDFVSQTQIDAIRHFALNLSWSGPEVPLHFRLGRSDVLSRLQQTCRDHSCRNHVVSIHFQAENTIHIEGMLYSQYGWLLTVQNEISFDSRQLRLENAIPQMIAPLTLRDTSQSPDVICIINPDYEGDTPELPSQWQRN